MCPAELSYSTYEYDDHFVIAPAINFSSRSNDFTINNLGENGKLVTEGFEYDSNTNPQFLSVEEIREFNRLAII